MIPKRYQLKKDAVAIVARGHPWLFRDQMSSAASIFRDGQWLRLVDGANRVIAHGIYEAEGAIAIRVLPSGDVTPGAMWVRDQLARSIANRESLATRTTGVRLVHGESDGLPAVVVDRFGDVAVVASYSAGSDALARFVARALPDSHISWRPARRRRDAVDLTQRALRGSPPPIAHFVEDGIDFAVDLAEGHKTGGYLDLRGLRRAVAAEPLAGARVLNLFSYTGMLGRAAERAGAAEIVHADQSARALAFAREHHVDDPRRHRFIELDLFEALPAGQFDLVIVDPPAMTSRREQVPKVLAAYRKLYTAARDRVAPGGALVAACCTSRIERDVFRQTVAAALGDGFALERTLPTEPDHPVGFPQADYLKIGWWRAKSR
ncbi:MAG TPA: class I SAM-dependent methyltransferase [Kofleriaceae bacterium]|jgi:23S rRNA G2069 N7-methylase RlmK/C1962 C5-methylase RlmI|nr:class I SAM-dependent methyltransferase [Kofleriaceae bacterium]